MIDLPALQEWCKGGRRQVDIVLGGPLSPTTEHIHVFDYDMNMGQDIADVSEINLVARKKRQIEALQRKIEKLESEVEQYGESDNGTKHN